MSFEEIFLKRVDHSQSFLQFLERLLESNFLVDCIIAAEGQFLRAHRLILAACSSYFEMLFSKENEKNPIVVLKDMKFEDLKDIVEFSYRGQIKIPKRRLTSFVNTAECLQISGIENDLSEKAVEMLSEEICLKRVNHSQSFLQFLERSLESSSLADCTFVAEGQYLKAHRVILSACSPYFELLFCEGNEKDPFVVLTDTKFKDLKALVNITYRGQIKIPECQFRSFHNTTESLQIGGVEVDCSNADMKCVEIRKNEIPLVLKREDCTLHVAPKHIGNISSSTCENVSQVICAVVDTVNCLPTANENVLNYISTKKLNHFYRADADTMDKSCTFDGASKECCTRNVNDLADQSVGGNVSASKQFPTNVTNLSFDEGDISNNSDKCSSKSHKPDSMTHSCKSQFSSCDGNVTPSSSVHLPPPSTQQKRALIHRSDSQQELLGENVHTGNLLAVKTEPEPEPEPEPLTEIFLPESECFIEPKNEVVMEEAPISEREEEGPEVTNAGLQNQESQNQRAVFIGTAGTCSEDSFILPHIAESSSTQDSATLFGFDNSARPTVVRPAVEQTQLKQHASDDFKPVSMDIDTATVPSSNDTSKSDHWESNPQDRLLKCSECYKTFLYPSKLKRHLLTHTGEKPYNCSECDMSFNQRHILNVHLRTHTGERPYKCTECDKSFNQIGNLIVHQRTHTGERPYACSECHKSFSQINHLITHQLIHTGERPYKCSVCHKSFSRANTFKRHQRVHT